MAGSIRIGCAAGFWGDSAEGARQLVERGRVDFLVFDYLAEITMALLARARAKRPEQGYATDFPALLGEHAAEIKRQGIRVVSNAGGVNLEACRAAIERLLERQGIHLEIAIVTGDDLLDRSEELRARGVREMVTGEPFPERPWSANAYLGALPIARALDAGADIVLTGRCVDSAVVLGPLMHGFGWAGEDYDRLAMGALAGHVIECGTQATGGITTDWREVADDWPEMGFPIVEVQPDGIFELGKPEGTGGRITPLKVAEQLVYEVGDPGAYLLPDVTCDFRHVRLTASGADRVRVEGARGRAPGRDYKVSVTWQDGFRCTGMMMIGGPEAVARAEAVAAAILERTRRLLDARGLGDYRRTHVEALGAEASWGPHARTRHTREVVLKLAVHHDDPGALELFAREFLPPATSMTQSITGFAGGRPKVTPLIRLFSCLVPKSELPVAVDGRPVEILPGAERPAPPEPVAAETEERAAADDGPRCTLPLIALAVGRSGDKGDSANIGVIARDARFVALLRAQLTAAAVERYLGHLLEGSVERFEWPGLDGFNFLLHGALGGGGTASLRHDPQGKMLAQILMDLPLEVPQRWLDDGWIDVRWQPGEPGA